MLAEYVISKPLIESTLPFEGFVKIIIDNSSAELSTSDTETAKVNEESSSKETEKSSTTGV